MPIPTSPTWQMADRLAEGNLAAIIVRLRDGGLSFRTIEHRLRDEFAIPVSAVTLGEWYRQLTADQEAVS